MKKTLFFISFFFLILIGALNIEMNADKYDKKPEFLGNAKYTSLMNDLIRINRLKEKYNEFVTIKKDTSIYELSGSEYIEKGKISSNYKVQLDGLSPDMFYFKIKGLDYYIKYNSVKASDEIIENSRYKKYIVFNKNIVTKNSTTFYNDDGTYITINKSYSLPIVIKETDKYYVEFNNKLFYVKKSDVSKEIYSDNTNEETASKIRTLTYHMVYNPKTDKCYNESICHSLEQFDSHMKYISENNYLSLTMKELEWFLDGKVRIPKKSVVVTLDDGSGVKNAVNIVEKYKVNATFFIITSKFDVSKIKTTYMDFQSHTHDLHNNWKCSGGSQGGEILCSSESKIINDINTSRAKLGGDVFALSYPFFDYNNRVVEALDKAGIRLAFIGQGSTDGYATAMKTDKMKIPRKTIFSTDSVQTIERYLK